MTFSSSNHALGWKAAVPLVTTFIALVSSNSASKWCSFVYRVIEFDNSRFNPTNPIQSYLFVSRNIGLWSYEGIDYTEVNDDMFALEEDLGKCYLYPEELEFDDYFEFARMTSVFTAITGGATVMVLLASTFCPFGKSVHWISSIVLVVTAIMEGLTQLIYKSTFCGGNRDYGESRIKIYCNASWGSSLSILSVFIWIFGAYSIASVVKERERNERNLAQRCIGDQEEHLVVVSTDTEASSPLKDPLLS